MRTAEQREEVIRAIGLLNVPLGIVHAVPFACFNGTTFEALRRRSKPA